MTPEEELHVTLSVLREQSEKIVKEVQQLKLWAYVIFVGLLAQFFRIGQ